MYVNSPFGICLAYFQEGHTEGKSVDGQRMYLYKYFSCEKVSLTPAMRLFAEQGVFMGASQETGLDFCALPPFSLLDVLRGARDAGGDHVSGAGKAS